MALIQRYIAAVVNQLPEKNQVEISKELEANILDMLPENPSEQDVASVLLELGDPTKLADAYRGEKRYLIGPFYYEKYLSILKTVVLIVAITTMLVSIFSLFIEKPQTGIISGVFKAFGSVFIGTTQAFLWVTIVFVILERSGYDTNGEKLQQKKWSLIDLPELKVKHKKISKVEVIFGMFFTILFTFALCFSAEIFGIYQQDHGKLIVTEPFFNIDELNKYVPFLIIVMLIQLAVLMLKFIKGKWDIQLAIMNGFSQVIGVVLSVMMIFDRKIFNLSFFEELSKLTEITFSDEILTKLQWGIVGMVIVLVLLDIIMGFINSGILKRQFKLSQNKWLA